MDEGAVSDAVPVERGLVALAVDLQRALVADRVGTLEDPVLPRAQAAEDTREHVLGAVEAQVGLHAGERIVSPSSCSPWALCSPSARPRSSSTSPTITPKTSA